MPIAYVNQTGHVGICSDVELAEHYRREYTTVPLTAVETGMVIRGLVPRRLLVAVQIRRIMREQEATNR